MASDLDRPKQGVIKALKPSQGTQKSLDKMKRGKEYVKERTDEVLGSLRDSSPDIFWELELGDPYDITVTFKIHDSSHAFLASQKRGPQRYNVM